MEDLRKELEEAKAKIEEIEKKLAQKESGVWKPENGDEYWFVMDEGIVAWNNYSNSHNHNIRYLMGNCFKTKQEAKFYYEKLKVIAELKRYEEPNDSAWDEANNHYFIYYDTLDGKIEIGFRTTTKLPTIHFESKVKAQEAIEAVGQDRIKKYYLEVEE